MLELLPNTQKKALKREYFLRLLIAVFLLLSVVGTLSLVSLSPSYFLSVEKEKIVSQTFEKLEKSNKSIAEDKMLQSDIKNSQEMLILLKPPERLISINGLISKIIDKKNSGIRIDEIAATSYKKGQYQILVKGNAINRDILKSFVENLKNGGLFDSVDLPISNFTKIADIDFNITLITSI